MCKKDLQYFKKCLASNGEITVLDKSSSQMTTYTNHNGKLVMRSSNGKTEGMEAVISFLASNANPQTEITVSKEGETGINTQFLNYFNKLEADYQNRA